jgi:hypothetical protein
MQQHIDNECVRAQRECEFSRFGCKAKFNSIPMQEHHESCPYVKVSHALLELEGEVIRLKKKLEQSSQTQKRRDPSPELSSPKRQRREFDMQAEPDE